MKNKRALANWIFNKISKEGTFTPQTIHRYLNEFEDVNTPKPPKE